MKAAMARSNADLRREGADGRVQSYKTQQNARRPHETGEDKDQMRFGKTRKDLRRQVLGLQDSNRILANPKILES